MEQPLSLLYLEDSEVTALITKTLLEKMKCKIVHVTTVADARKFLSQERFDVIIADLNVPDSTGIDTVRALRVYGVPIIVLTLYDDINVAESALHEGAYDFMIKPLAGANNLILKIGLAKNSLPHNCLSCKHKRSREMIEARAWEQLKPYITFQVPTQE